MNKKKIHEFTTDLFTGLMYLMKAFVIVSVMFVAFLAILSFIALAMTFWQVTVTVIVLFFVSMAFLHFISRPSDDKTD